MGASVGASVGGTGVSGVIVGGTVVLVGGTDVLVGGTEVCVGGFGVLVAVGGRAGMNGTQILSPAVMMSGSLMQFANWSSTTSIPKILLKL